MSIYLTGNMSLCHVSSGSHNKNNALLIVLLEFVFSVCICFYSPFIRATLARRKVMRPGLYTTIVGKGAGAPEAEGRNWEKRTPERMRKIVCKIKNYIVETSLKAKPELKPITHGLGIPWLPWGEGEGTLKFSTLKIGNLFWKILRIPLKGWESPPPPSWFIGLI